MDDWRGRWRTIQAGLKVVGTLGILFQAQQQNLVGPLQTVLDQLSQLPFHIGKQLYQDVLWSVGEKSSCATFKGFK